MAENDILSKSCRFYFRGWGGERGAWVCMSRGGGQRERESKSVSMFNTEPDMGLKPTTLRS